MTRTPFSKFTAAGAFLIASMLGGVAGNAADAPAPTKIPGFDATWKDMSKEQKAKYMKSTVLPEMKKVFQAFDAKRYKVFNCANCHGKQAKAREFKMPSPEVPKLPGTHEGFMALLKEKPKLEPVAKFMGEQVKPKVAALLGQPEFDPKKPAAGGFGCQNCHVIEKAN